MARPKKYETHVQPKLVIIAAWARDGLTLDDIANNLDIAKSTLCDYQNQYSELSDALKTGKEEADIIVENALYKRAVGYEYEEVTKEAVPFTTTKVVDGEQIEVTDYKLSVTKIVTKQMAPDTTAQIFWLKNRRPKSWKDKHEIDGNLALTIKVGMPQPPGDADDDD